MLKVLNILIPQQFHLKTKVLLLFLFYSSVELFIYEFLSKYFYPL